MISVIVVTYNRPASLDRCLSSLCAQKDAQDYEIIVVDNGSAGQASWSGTQECRGRIRFIRSAARLSVSDAKELGMASCRGDTIAFIDDDCSASSSWLKDIRALIQEFDCIGGPVFLAEGTKLPWWWRRSMDWLIGVNPSPDGSYPPLGSNVAFRKYVLDDIGQAAPAGRQSSGLLPYAEDNARLDQALDRGYSLGITKQMAVYHDPGAGRLRLRALLRRASQEGAAQARAHGSFHPRLGFPGIIYQAALLIGTLDIGRLFRLVSCASYLLHSFCPGVREKPATIPKLLILDITHSCNLTCRICQLWKTAQVNADLGLDEIKKVLSEAAELGIPEIALSGGEPLLREDIFDILEHARINRLKHVGILTNGVAIQKNLGKLTPYLTDSTANLVISLDSLQARVHNLIRNSPLAHQETTAALASLSSLKKQDPRICFDMISIIMDPNLEELTDLARFAQSLGAHSLQFQPLVPDNMAMTKRMRSEFWISGDRLSVLDKSIDAIIVFKEQHPHFIKNSKENLLLVKKYYRQTLGKADVRCLSADKTILLSSQGVYYSCFASYGTAKDSSLKEIVEGKQIAAARKKASQCASPCLLPCFCDS